MIHQGMVLPQGKWCENAMIEILSRAGIRVWPSTRREDCGPDKTDWWGEVDEILAFQYGTNKEDIMGPKGMDALRHGVIPIWIDPQMVEHAIDTGDLQPVVREYVRLTRQIRRAFSWFRPLPAPRRLLKAA